MKKILKCKDRPKSKVIDKIKKLISKKNKAVIGIKGVREIKESFENWDDEWHPSETF